MRNYSKAILVCFILLPFVTNAQSITGNLKYINEQFSLYNEYETSFNVDTRTKELICEDEFGILKAYWKDVEMRVSNGNVGIFCLDGENTCIRYYDKNGNRKADDDYNNYTMGLSSNGELIPHVNVVITKFEELKRLTLASSDNGYSSTVNGNLKAQIDAELYTINTIFQRSSEYKNTYFFDYSTNTITSKTENCKAVIPIKAGLSLNYYKRDGGGYGEGFFFENADNSILESCTSFEDYTEKTYEYVNNYSDVQTVIRSLNNIISLARGNNSSTSTPPSGNSESILNYINGEFSKYNAYNTVWKVDYKTKQLIWSNDFGTNYVDLSSSEVRVDNTNSWIGVYCLTGDKCIKQITTSGSATYYDQYTMSLNDDSKMIGHIATVANKFAELKNIVLKNTSSKPSSHEGDTPD